MSIQSDVEYVKSVAESGRSAPLLSGRFSIIWGGLAVIALLLHWAVLADVVDWPEQALGALWAGYGVTGAVLSWIAGSLMGAKPGAAAAGNVASNAAWTAATIAIFAFAVATTLRVMFAADGGRPDSAAFDAILPVAFACYGLSFTVTARLARARWIYWLAAASFAALFVSTLLVGRPELYLFAAAVVFLVAVAPGVVMLRSEPAASR